MTLGTFICVTVAVCAVWLIAVLIGNANRLQAALDSGNAYIEALKEQDTRLRKELLLIQGLALCTEMIRKDLADAGVIGKGVPPMMLTEAILGAIQKAKRAPDASEDSQRLNWLEENKAALLILYGSKDATGRNLYFDGWSVNGTVESASSVRLAIDNARHMEPQTQRVLGTTGDVETLAYSEPVLNQDWEDKR